VRTSYSRRKSDYLYDIEIREVADAASARRFCARVVNLVRLKSGATESVNADVPDQHAATRADAVVKVEAAVDRWVKKHFTDA
jgi:hypothetical protein